MSLFFISKSFFLGRKDGDQFSGNNVSLHARLSLLKDTEIRAGMEIKNMLFHF
jgi:hypothetical protein